MPPARHRAQRDPVLSPHHVAGAGVEGVAQGEVGEPRGSGVDRAVRSEGTGEVHRDRPHGVRPERALTRDDNLELVRLVEMRVCHLARILLDQEGHWKHRILRRIGVAGRHVVARRAEIKRVPEAHAVARRSAPAVGLRSLGGGDERHDVTLPGAAISVMPAPP